MTNAEIGGGQILASPGSGSMVENLYVRRRVMVLAVHEHEVENLSMMNGLSSLAFSIFAGLLSFALGIWVNKAFQTDPTPASNVLANVVAPGAIILAVVALVVGVVLFRRRNSTLDKIKNQSQSVAG